jgi:hypothetical protein
MSRNRSKRALRKAMAQVRVDVVPLERTAYETDGLRYYKGCIYTNANWLVQ